MKNTDFTAEELHEMETLQIRGGASNNPMNPMSQDQCINSAAGCGAGVTQKGCSNTVMGCGSHIEIGCTIVPVYKDCTKPDN